MQIDWDIAKLILPSWHGNLFETEYNSSVAIWTNSYVFLLQISCSVFVPKIWKLIDSRESYCKNNKNDENWELSYILFSLHIYF